MLVETQDKALRRISELKEQCALEQSAKVSIRCNIKSIGHSNLTNKSSPSGDLLFV